VKYFILKYHSDYLLTLVSQYLIKGKPGKPASTKIFTKNIQAES